MGDTGNISELITKMKSNPNTTGGKQGKNALKKLKRKLDTSNNSPDVSLSQSPGNKQTKPNNKNKGKKSKKENAADLNSSVDILPNIVKAQNAVEKGGVAGAAKGKQISLKNKKNNKKPKVNESIENDDDENDDNLSEESDDDVDMEASIEEGPVSDDDEEDDEKVVTNKVKKQQEQATGKKQNENVKNKEDDERTIFVGNLCVTTDKASLMKLFKKYGKINTVRLRSIPIADMRVPRDVAAKTKQINPKAKSSNGYVKFEEKESALKALAENGTVFKGRHIRVDSCIKEAQDNSESVHAIFVGNFNMKSDEEELWKAFECCGKIKSVRLIRDKRTNIPKGFGYVNFENKDSVELALQMEPTLNGRQLRVKRYTVTPNIKKERSPNKKQNQPKKQKPNKKDNSATNENGEVKKEEKKAFSPKFNKFDKKKQKNNLNKKFKPKTNKAKGKA